MTFSLTRSVMDLSAEIRLNIYKHLFITRNSIHLTSNGLHVSPISLSAQVLQCCKIVYEEALPILYCNQIYVIGFEYDIHIYRNLASGRGTSLVRSFEVFQSLRSHLNPEKTFSAELAATLCRLPNLKQVQLLVDLGNSRMFDTVADVLERILKHRSTQDCGEFLLSKHARKPSLIVDARASKLQGTLSAIQYKFRAMCSLSAETLTIVGDITQIRMREGIGALFWDWWDTTSEERFDQVGPDMASFDRC